MIHFTLIYLAFFTGAVHANEIDNKLENECYTEISFFCPKIEPRANPWMRCLDKYSDAITAKCKAAVQATKIALSPKPVESSTATVSSNPAQQAAAMASAPMDTRLTQM